MKRFNHPDPETLSRLADNALVPETAHALRRHLEECSRCRATLQRFKRLETDVPAGLAAGLTFTGDINLEKRVMQDLNARRKTGEESRRPGWSVFVTRGRFYLQAASIAAILILGALIFKSPVQLPPPADASAIVTAIGGSAASVMILETETRHHTIIWYQEG